MNEPIRWCLSTPTATVGKLTKRLAITGVQVQEHGLTAIEKVDKRFKPARSHPAVETEALRQQEIQRILTERLDAELPEPLAVVLEREERQRVQVREQLSADE